jgi:hypothetical protein
MSAPRTMTSAAALSSLGAAVDRVTAAAGLARAVADHVPAARCGRAAKGLRKGARSARRLATPSPAQLGPGQKPGLFFIHIPSVASLERTDFAHTSSAS